MKRNPFLKVEQKINRAVYNNPATLHVVVRRKSYDAYSGDLSREDFDFTRTVYLGDPKTLSDFILSTQEYKSGDLLVDTAYKDFMDAVAETRETDPVVTVDGVAKTLPDLRSGTPIDTTADWIEFSGRKWRFVKVVPRTHWAGTPSVVRLHMREVPSDAE